MFLSEEKLFSVATAYVRIFDILLLKRKNINQNFQRLYHRTRAILRPTLCFLLFRIALEIRHFRRLKTGRRMIRIVKGHDTEEALNISFRKWKTSTGPFEECVDNWRACERTYFGVVRTLKLVFCIRRKTNRCHRKRLREIGFSRTVTFEMRWIS